MFRKDNYKKAAAILETCKNKRLKISCAESCTGGMLSALLTDVPGSSAVFEGGFICYSNMMKQLFLNVHSDSLEEYGAVSERVAMEMAAHCRSLTKTSIAIGITGIAGPEGGTADKPVGLVYIAISTTTHAEVKRHVFKGNRSEVRQQAVDHALTMIESALTMSFSSFA